ncbi:MAG: cysteine hydrolase [Chloroflexi bacterium]|nr:cysteine hydrolase [Chloroflexota bacterium]
MAALMNLVEKVNPAHTALVLVDVQNDFYSKGGFADLRRKPGATPEVSSVIPQLRRFVEGVRKTKVRLVFIRLVCDERNFSGPEIAMRERRFQMLAARLSGPEKAASPGKGAEMFACKVGTWGADFVEEIGPKAEDFVVTKSQYSAFIGTNLDILLKGQGIRTLVLCGGASNMCLGTTAQDGFMLGYYIVLIRDLSTGAPDFHQAMLSNIDLNFGEIVSSSDLLEIWKG